MNPTQSPFAARSDLWTEQPRRTARVRRSLARVFTTLYLLQTLLATLPAYAQISAAPGAPAGQKPLIDAAANGVPLVLIAPPNASGVSRNQYGQFNVAPKGLILNNATGNVQTQLGGWVKGNMLLGSTPARIILNEVTGASPSHLRGALEVAGQRADVVIANPNGISCDGCGFLNTSRATLSSGVPLFNGSGALTGFDVRAGVLHIGPGGLSAMEQQQLDLYARGLTVEGEVWTQNLQAILGANQVNTAAAGSAPAITPHAPVTTTGDTPLFAVDLKALGGMYAGSIYLIATEKGLGVNSTGRMATLAGNLELSANGQLTLKDSYSVRNTNLSAAGPVNLTGQNQAEGRMSLQGQGVRTAGASVVAGQLDIDAGTGALHNEGGTLQATSTGNAQAGAAATGAGAGADALRISATGIHNNAGAIQANGAVVLDARGADVRNQQGLLTGGAVTVANAQQLHNQAGTIYSNADLNLAVGALHNQQGAIATQGKLTVSTGNAIPGSGSTPNASLSNAGGLLQSGAAMELKTGSSGELDTTGGSIDSGGQLTLQAGVLKATGARITANGDIAASASVGASANVGASVDAGGSTLSAGQNLSIASAGSLNAEGADLVAGGNLNLQGTGINTANARIAAHDLTLNAGTGALHNAAGTLQATGSLNALAQGITNTGGTIAANGEVNVNAGTGELRNESGLIYSAQGQAHIAAGALHNTGGVLAAATALTVQGGPLRNTEGVVSGGHSASINVHGLTNEAGVIEAGAGGLSIDTQGQALTNTASGSTRGIVSSGDITITAGEVINTTISGTDTSTGGAGYIGASGALTVTASGNLTNTAGAVITGVASATLNVAGDVVNAGLITAGTAAIQAGGQVSNAAGATITASSMTVEANGNLTNAGQIAAVNAALRTGGHLTNTAGATLSAATAATLSAAADVVNAGLIAAGTAAIQASGQISNAAGATITATAMTLDATGTLTNAGQIAAGDATLRTGGNLSNSAGATLSAATAATIDAGGDATNAGLITAGTAAIKSAGHVTNTGSLTAAAQLDVEAGGDMANAAGATIEGGATTLKAGGELANAGLINSTGGATDITAGAIRNTGRIYGDSVTITGATYNSANVDDEGAVIASRSGDISIEGPLSNTAGGLILSLNDLTVSGAALNHGSTLSADRHLAIGGALTNTNAGLNLTTVTRHEATGGFYIQPAGSSAAYAPQDMIYDPRQSGSWVLPSTTYPLAQFGGAARPLMSSCTNPEIGDPICGNFYSTADPIWALMGVASPGPGPGAPPEGCLIDTGGMAAIPVTTGSCGSYWDAAFAYQASLPAHHAQLDAAITAFNNDLAARTVSNWYELSVTGQTVSETVVTASQPGQVLAGGNMTLNGGTNQDSVIVAGGNLDGGALQNLATPGQRQTTQEGTMVYSWGEHDGGIFGSGYQRKRSAAQPIANAPTVQSFDLPLVRYLAGTPPGSVVTPVSLPAGSDGAPDSAPGSAPGTVPGAEPDGTPDAGETGAGATPASQPSLPGSRIAAVERARQQGASVPPGAPALAGITVGAPQVAAPPRTPLPLPVKAEGYLTVTSQGAVRVPGSQLFALNNAPGARFLVETDPAFTGYRQWLSSDYFLAQLALDPERSFKRYGDGFAEQRLVDDQILALSGRRYLSGYSSTEAQYQDLLDAGVQFARRFQLSPGVALTAEQMASLTSDIVWLEVKTVTLPDGSTVQALVPTVYLRRPVEGDLSPAGALIAGTNVTLRSAGDLVNSGTIAATGDEAAGDKATGDASATGRLVIEARNLTNSGTLAGNAITATAADTINNAGGVIQGLGPASVASLNARDIILRTTVQTSTREVAGANGTGTGTTTNTDRIATIVADSVTLAALNNIDLKGARVQATGNLTATAGGNFTSDAVQTGYTLDIPVGGTSKANSQVRTGHYRIDATTWQLTTLQAAGNLNITASGDASFKGTNADAAGDLTVQARNITLEAAKEKFAFDQQSARKSGYERFAQSDEALTGGVFTAGNNATLSATGDKAQGQGNISVTGAVVSASKGAASLTATNNVVVQNATTTHTREEESYRSSKGFLSSSTTQRDSASQTTAVAGSTLSGATVDIQAGGNIAVQGSGVVSDTRTTLNAAGNVSITVSTETHQSDSSSSHKKSGLFGSGSSITLGTRKESSDTGSQSTTAAGSTIGAVTGNVTIRAGGLFTQRGSDVTAPGGDVDILAKANEITEARDTTTSQSEQKFSQSGLSVGISSALISAAQTVGQMASAAGRTDDTRMQALAAAAGVLALKNNAADISNAAQALGEGDFMGAGSLSVGIGSSKSQSQTASTSDTARQSKVIAGGNVTIRATGGGDDSNVLIRGSTVQAGNTLILDADNKVLLQAARNETTQTSTQSSRSASIGLSVGAAGLGVTASGSTSRGNAEGQDVRFSNTQAKGNTVVIKSGGDTDISGAVVTGNTVKADIDGNLTIQSQQDTSTYTERSRSAGGSLTVGAGVGGSVSAARTSIDSSYASVTEQSGIRAGDGGFQIQVQGRTNLVGGAITSTQTAIDQGGNEFVGKGGVTTSDIQNSASYKGSSAGFTIGAGSNLKDGGAGAGSQRGNASSSTQAAISGIAGNQAARTGDVQTGIAPIFNRDAVEREIKAQTAIFTEFGRQAIPAAAGFADQKAVELRREGKEAEAAQWDEGGANRTALYGALGLLAGGVSGAAGAVAGATLVPTLGEEIAALNLPEPVRQGVTEVMGMAMGAAAGGTVGAATALPQTAFNYVSHSPFANVRLAVSRENARLINECGNSCTLADLRRMDIQLQKLEAAGNLAAVAERSAMSAEQAGQFQQLALELIPFYGNAESVRQLLTGRTTVTDEEASRFWAAVGVVPVVGGMLQRVGRSTADVVQALVAADKAAGLATQPGLINDANRLFKQYIDDIEIQTGYRLGQAQRAALANEMRTGSHAVTLSPVENWAVRNDFNAKRPELISEWEKQTGQSWPRYVEPVLSKDGTRELRRAGDVFDSHHVIPISNNGPAEWWNMTPARYPDQHQGGIHAADSPLRKLQGAAKK